MGADQAFLGCFRTDGYIVCEEHEEILRAAWVEEQALQKQKEKEVCVCTHMLIIFSVFESHFKSKCFFFYVF